MNDRLLVTTTKGRRLMGQVKHRPEPVDQRRRVYDTAGLPVAAVVAARSDLDGQLLAECERGHVYLLDGAAKDWAATDGVCPRCRVLGHTPGDQEALPHGD